jgi:hypothetical protein
LSGFRTRNLKSSLLTLALTGPAAVLAAVAIGTAGAAPASAAARPASVTSTVQVAGIVQVAGSSPAVSARSGAKATIALDGFARPLSGAAKEAAAKARTTPRGIARSMLRHFGWWPGQFKDLNWLWDRESSWNVRAFNPYSGATGIPQAVPGSKMASAGPNWRTSARTQIRWGLRYIKSRYGSPRRAWYHEVDRGWY